MGTFRSMSKTVLGMQILFLLLLGYSFLYLEPGSASYVAAQLALIPVVLTLVITLVALRWDWDPF